MSAPRIRSALRRSLKPLILSVVSVFFFRAVNDYLSVDIRNDRVYPYNEQVADSSKRVNVSSDIMPNAGLSQDILYSLKKHRYRDDGLLEVNPAGAHPIFALVQRAEEEWKGKLVSASSTIDDAAVEYKRRYHRLPPAGFDRWWKYVQDNNVQLPDEYDQIHRDLEPFWGIDPKDLYHIQRDWEAHVDSYTIGKDAPDSSISVLNYSLPEGKATRTGLLSSAYLVQGLLKDIEKHLPPFRAVFSPHDNPNLFTDYELLEAARQAARKGKTIDIKAPPEVKLHGWISACHPFSPAWNDPMDWKNPAPAKEKAKTFIYDHRASMDPCQHPSHLLQHGQFLSNHNGPVPHRTVIPQFSFCTTPLHHDMMAAIPINWVKDLPPEQNLPWHLRTDERLLWRGRNTGMRHTPDSPWAESQRDRLVRWAVQDLGAQITVLPPPKNDYTPVGKGTPLTKGDIASALLDIQFAGEPINCPPEYCPELAKMFVYHKPQTLQAAGNYKYVLDVDGNGWSSRFERLMVSNSLVFKSTIYPEWFSDRVAPWVHYVPVQVDLSDLYDSLLFFRGDTNGVDAHDELALRIASAGREWTKTFWRREDMTAYWFRCVLAALYGFLVPIGVIELLIPIPPFVTRLFLEYARVMSMDRLELNYHSSSLHDETGE